jgi:hypothetical protein
MVPCHMLLSRSFLLRALPSNETRKETILVCLRTAVRPYAGLYSTVRNTNCLVRMLSGRMHERNEPGLSRSNEDTLPLQLS